MFIRFFGHIFSALALLLVAGALTVAGAVWYYGRDLPEYEQLADYKPPQSSLVYDDDGAVIARFARQRRAFVPIDEIPPMVQSAFISAEDKNFRDHAGIDPVGIAKAMVRNVNTLRNGGRMSGASTITQQVVKNMLLTNERSISRKVREAVLAVQIERELSKDRILEIYLNQIYLGARSYGVGAASKTYFGKDMEFLAPEEAAYLAALPKAPSALHPERNAKAALARRNYVLTEMEENGHLSAEEAEAAKAKPLLTRLNDNEREESYDFSSAYMIEEVRGLLLEEFAKQAVDAGNAKPEEAADSELYGGGLNIRTTLDREMQEYASRALREGLFSYSKRGAYKGPLGTTDPDGDWREALEKNDFPKDFDDWTLGVVLTVRDEKGTALVGLRNQEKAVTVTFDAIKWARRRIEGSGRGPDPKVISDILERGDIVYLTPGEKAKDGDVQTVSNAKLADLDEIVWGLRQLPDANGAVIAMEPDTGRVLAMQGGLSVQQSKFNRSTQAKRQPGSSFKPIVYAAALDHGYTPASIVLDAPVTVDQGNGEGLWKPSNYNEGEFYGPIPLRIGLEKSKNLITVRVAQDVGMDVISDYARRFGVYDNMPPLISFSLGAGETTLMRMVTAYSMFDNGGKHIAPRLVESIKDDAGEPVDLGVDWVVPTTPVEPVQVIDPITAFQTVSLMEGVVQRGTATKLTRLGFPVAGKTGTTNDARDAWFVGFTPDLVFGCYIGYDTPKSLGKRASGGALCGPVFEQFMREAMTDRTPRKFEAPKGVSLVKIDRRNGERVGEDVFGKNVIWEAFRSGTSPNDVGAGNNGDTVAGGGFVPSIGGIGGTAMQPDLAGASYSGGFVPSGPLQQPDEQPGQVNPQQQVDPNRPITRSTSTVPSGNEPLIRFDPNTGEMIVSQDPAISVEPAPGVVYQQPETGAYQPIPRAPEQQFQRQGIAPYDPASVANAAPANGFVPGQVPTPNAEDVSGGRGLY